ncbi:AraC family transcriptional regulator [Jeotgalibacillus proteolyticus]|uniref:AraC family transcriptional regulator n=1 Tax=Jeotgalibacillus proteolyticus TaxID=2082395 RepID=A0A2S5G6E2_9BACL|nr:AraC family transcriptional regulator [Jeotgalibacillus proteolyticus]PPA68535.1 AraC family transcriptional regulator [Jeotgalibacillus proteolyticus]
MLYRQNEIHHSFVYHSSNDPLTEAARIVSIGFEKRASTDYYWDGRMRLNDGNTCIFQYTINGFGRFQAAERTYTIGPGEAFIVKVPSEHCYYLPEESAEWEFLFITLEGTKAQECWDLLLKKYGHVIKADANDPLIFLLQKIYQFVLKEGINDTFISSAQGYEFIMGLHRFSRGLSRPQSELPEDILKAANYMKNHYEKHLSLDDITDYAGLSKYYFTNKFQKHMKTTPMQFLAKVRLQKSMDLLITTDKTVQEIAVETGYTNANYFSKVFRKMIGMSPDRFRKDKKMVDFNHVIF